MTKTDNSIEEILYKFADYIRHHEKTGLGGHWNQRTVEQALTKREQRKVLEARIAELEALESKLDFVSCVPDCTPERHSRHDGSFQTWLRHGELIKDRIATLQKQLKELDDD